MIPERLLHRVADLLRRSGAEDAEALIRALELVAVPSDDDLANLWRSISGIAVAITVSREVLLSVGDGFDRALVLDELVRGLASNLVQRAPPANVVGMRPDAERPFLPMFSDHSVEGGVTITAALGIAASTAVPPIRRRY